MERGREEKTKYKRTITANHEKNLHKDTTTTTKKRAVSFDMNKGTNLKSSDDIPDIVF